MDTIKAFFMNLFSSFKKGQSTVESERVVGIDIGTSSIKIVELRKKDGKAFLETYSTISLGPYANQEVGSVTNLNPDVLTKALNEALKEGGVQTKNAAFAIPSSASMVFIVELPANVAAAQLNEVIPTEARKYIPVPISEVSLDYWVLPKHDDLGDGGYDSKDKTEVIVAAMHNEMVEKYKAIAVSSALASDIFEIEIFSEIRSTFAHELSAVLFIDMGASKTKLAIVEYGVVRNFHIINKGSSDITSTLAQAMTVPFIKAEELKREHGLLGEGENKKISDTIKLSIDYVIAETSNVIQNFERKYNKPISKVILSGAGSLLPGFKELAMTTFKVEIVKASPFEKVTVPEFVAQVLSETGPEFSVALGVALRKLG